MKLAVDCRSVGSSMTGVGRYVWSLGLTVARLQGPGNCLLLLRKGVGQHWSQQATEAGAQVAFVHLSHEAHPWSDLWEQTVLPVWIRTHGVGVFISGIFQLPAWSLGARRIFVCHDMVPFMFSETMPARFANYVRFQTRFCARQAHRILVNSERTKQDLESWVPSARGKVRVVYPSLAGLPEGSIANSENLSIGVEEPYFLAVGTTEPRKNIPFLLESYSGARSLCSALPRLVLVGQPGDEDGKIRTTIRDKGLDSSVSLTGYVSDSQLIQLYSNAVICLYPSLYEGFGFPPLEAMRAGAPVVCSNRGSLGEVVGSGGLLLDPTDREAWTQSMIQLWKDPDRRQALARQGRDRAAFFSRDTEASMAQEALREWVRPHG